MTTKQNHRPDVLCVDEIRNEAEVKAAVEHALGGVQVLASVHATDLGEVVNQSKNEMNELIGGVRLLIARFPTSHV